MIMSIFLNLSFAPVMLGFGFVFFLPFWYFIFSLKFEKKNSQESSLDFLPTDLVFICGKMRKEGEWNRTR